MAKSEVKTVLLMILFFFGTLTSCTFLWAGDSLYAGLHLFAKVFLGILTFFFGITTLWFCEGTSSNQVLFYKVSQYVILVECAILIFCI